MQNGFESSKKQNELESFIPGRDVNQIKALLEAYKRNGTPDPSTTW